MWIRSQDKRILVDSKRVILLHPNTFREKYEIVNYITYRPTNDNDSCEDYDTLGKYDTENEALDVLDKIERAIISDEKVYSMSNDEYTDFVVQII